MWGRDLGLNTCCSSPDFKREATKEVCVCMARTSCQSSNTYAHPVLNAENNRSCRCRYTFAYLHLWRCLIVLALPFDRKKLLLFELICHSFRCCQCDRQCCCHRSDIAASAAGYCQSSDNVNAGKSAANDFLVPFYRECNGVIRLQI